MTLIPRAQQSSLRTRRHPWRIMLALIVLVAAQISTVAMAQDDPIPVEVAPDGATTVPDIFDVPISNTGQRERLRMATPNGLDIGSGDPDGHGDLIGETMRRCFEISGVFEVYGPDRYFFDPDSEGLTEGTINFQNWFNTNAQLVVRAGFADNGSSVDLDFRLYNVDSESEIDIDWDSRSVSDGDVRDATYDFINAVIEYYTSVPGIFGSRMALVGQSRSGAREIYTIGMDGTGLSSVTENESINLSPAYGPGGEMFFTSYQAGDPDLYLGDTAVSSRQGMELGAAMGPDGEIAVAMSFEGNTEIYIIDVDGEILRRCTDNLSEDVSPSWSPGGSQIAFVSDRSGRPQIYVMNADCSGQRRVTFAGNYNTTPDWSPNGDLIAFTGRDSRNRFDIFTVEVSTGFIRRLTQDQGNNEEPTWSPDGRYLAFQSNRGSSSYRLYVMTEDGEFQYLITPSGAGYTQPCWQ